MATQYPIEGSTSNQIAGSVEAGVRSGALPAGSRLPTVRGLSDRLGVSPGTVAAAYTTLRRRGIVETDGRRGTRVRLESEAPRARNRLPVPPGARDLSGGEPDPRSLPALAPALRRLAPEPVVYSEGGLLPAFSDLARQRLLGDGVPADRILAASGCLDGVERVLSARLAPGDAVAVEDPGWSALLDLLAGMNLRRVPVQVDDQGPQPDSVRRAIRGGAKALILTNRAQNPTGAALSGDRADQLRAVLTDGHLTTGGHPGTGNHATTGNHPAAGCYPSTGGAKAADLLVIEDDHAAELAREPLHTLAGTTTAWAFVRSLSKPYGPDLRCAVLTGDEETMGRVEGRQWLGARWVSTILQALVVELWTEPAVDRQIAAAGRRYDLRREELLAALTERGIPASGRSGLNIWVPANDETAACARLLEAGWVVAPGSMFRIASRSGIRVTISTLEPQDVAPLADAISDALHPAVRRPTA